jgi:hypothetical protein
MNKGKVAGSAGIFLKTKDATAQVKQVFVSGNAALEGGQDTAMKVFAAPPVHLR